MATIVQLVYSSFRKIEKSSVQSFEEAIHVFETYPWQKESDFASRMKSNRFPPEIIFINDENEKLSIAGNGSEFTIFFESQGKFIEIHLSNDLSLNSEGIIPQDYVKLFIEGSLRESLDSDAFQKVSTNEYNRSEHKLFKIEKTAKWDVFIPVFFLYFLSIVCIMIGILSNDSTAIFTISLVLLLTLGTSLQYTLLYFNYLKYNRDAILMIHEANGVFIYKDRKQTFKFTKEDVISKEHIKKDFKFDKSPRMEYLRLGLNNNTIIITSLMGYCSDIANLLGGDFSNLVMTIPFVRFKK